MAKKNRWKQPNNRDLVWFVPRKCFYQFFRPKLLVFLLFLCFTFSYFQTYKTAKSNGVQLWDEEKYSTFLFIAVISRASDSFVRSAIRSSWLKEKNSQIQHKFFLGAENLTESQLGKLRMEGKEYGDIVVLDVDDTYLNLTLKTILAFEWISKHVNASFVLKSDSDVYINLDKLVESLKNEATTKNFYMGTLVQFGSSRPLKLDGWKNHRWYTSSEEYPFHFWPPYVFGFAYVVSTDLVHVIAQCRPHNLACSTNGSYHLCVNHDCPFQLVKFEDVTVGGIIFFHSNKDLPHSLLNCRESICLLAGRQLTIAKDNENFINEPYYYGKRKCKESFVAMHRQNKPQ
ncbi:hypothetical protein GAYE_SCF00G1808 [Galdieria yellowstonensis]|uniref:Hexosyltransferase n=1 Tax=Galdieria yellowstonensis TaxID=3028027 RepID=A0AAV9I942_9RHOD|nr:hypothetical protein GAYE_SCF00G1808 [Galdieria yellowstonensis]